LKTRLNDVLHFERAEITSLNIISGLFSYGLRLNHSKNDAAPYVVFWIFRPKQLKDALELNGWQINQG